MYAVARRPTRQAHVVSGVVFTDRAAVAGAGIGRDQIAEPARGTPGLDDRIAARVGQIGVALGIGGIADVCLWGKTTCRRGRRHGPWSARDPPRAFGAAATQGEAI